MKVWLLLELLISSAVAVSFAFAPPGLESLSSRTRLSTMTFSSRVVVVTESNDVPLAAIDGKPTLVYWKICGLAQTIRMALALGGADFCDVQIEAGDPASELYKQTWFAVKPSLETKMAFPNLPYYMDDTVALSQSNAILKYVGRKYSLLGPPEKEYILDMALEQAIDLDTAYVRLAYGAKSEEDMKAWIEGRVPRLLCKWENLLGSQDFLLGNKPTVADLKLFEVLRKIHVTEVELCGKEGDTTIGSSTKLAEFVKRVKAVPEIKAYLESDSFLERPFNNPHAKFR